MFSSVSTLKGQSVYESYPQMDTPSTAYKANNKYANFPPMMHDGRNITSSWQPGTFVDEAIRKDNNIVSNWQYRKYLTDNAEQIRNHNFKQACNDVGYYVRNEPDGSDRSTTYRTPYVYKDSQAPVQHIGASASELKDLYLTKEQLQARQVVPSMTQAELLQNWGSYMHPHLTKEAKSAKEKQ